MDSIGSFAESLILEDLEGISQGKKTTFGTGGVAAEADMPDISNINLDSNHVQALISGKNISREMVPIQESLQEEYYEEPQAPTSDPISALVEQLSYLVEKAESLVTRLDEMTQTVGMGGTSQKFNLMQSEPFTAPPAPKVMNKVKKLRKYRRR